MRVGRIAGLVLVCATLTAACGQSGARADDSTGYLTPAQVPDTAALIGPPPAAGSAALADDEATYRATRKLEGQSRWRLAAKDAAFGAAEMLNAYSCALGVTLTPKSAPVLERLLDRVSNDTEAGSGRAKRVYHRTRPFVTLGGDICTPGEDWLKTSYSYPSGHSTFGWASGLVVAAAAPDSAEAVMARADAYGESRVICGVHYESDVAAGRKIGAAVFAALQTDAAFQADLAAARAELARLRAAPHSAPDAGECAVEAAASR
jgi:acid phosphatase (class A)